MCCLEGYSSSLGRDLKEHLEDSVGLGSHKVGRPEPQTCG